MGVALALMVVGLDFGCVKPVLRNIVHVGFAWNGRELNGPLSGRHRTTAVRQCSYA
jgi:hypothetical protein